MPQEEENNFTSGGQFDFLDRIAFLSSVNQALLVINTISSIMLNFQKSIPVEGEWQVGDVVLSMGLASTS